MRIKIVLTTGLCPFASRLRGQAFKIYDVRYDYGEPFPWRMDDPKVAFPIYKQAQELGIDLIGVHKGSRSVRNS